MVKTSSVWFFGTSHFAVPYLRALTADDRFDVTLVITQPDKPAGRGKMMTPPPIKDIAEKQGLKVLQPKNINDYSQFSILNSQFVPPDFFVVIAYGQILSEEILRIPRIAPINIHYSLLPRWRGAAPIQHSILAGDTETGIAIQKMVRELDAGMILAQEKIAIRPRETFTSLHDRLAERGVPLLIQTLLHPLTPIPQSTTGVTVCRKLRREDGVVDPETMTAGQIDRKVRALNPWPGVTVTLSGQSVKLLETSLESVRSSTPLPCAHGTILHLVTVQPAGKKPMAGAEWMRGRQPRNPKQPK